MLTRLQKYFQFPSFFLKDSPLFSRINIVRHNAEVEQLRAASRRSSSERVDGQGLKPKEREIVPDTATNDDAVIPAGFKRLRTIRVCVCCGGRIQDEGQSIRNSSTCERCNEAFGDTDLPKAQTRLNVSTEQSKGPRSVWVFWLAGSLAAGGAS